MTQHGDARVLLQILHHHILHQLGCDRLTFAIDGALRHDDNV